MIDPVKAKSLLDEVIHLTTELKYAEARYNMYMMTGNDIKSSAANVTSNEIAKNTNPFKDIKPNSTVVSVNKNNGGLVTCNICGSNTLIYNGLTLMCECGKWSLQPEDLENLTVITVL